MSGPEFHQTGYGRQFFEHQLPELIHQLTRLAGALERIASHEYRADRRHRGMVDASEVDDLKRAARTALAKKGTAL